jgi:predicted MFS family arabinose efflux permease
MHSLPRQFSRKFSERRILLIIALVQFINILDFMMVMPLGPDFAASLHIPLQHLGYIGGAYTMASAVTGLIGALFLDRYDRKRVILITLMGLSFATILPAFATNMSMLVGARILAGMFGGPLTALSLSMLADVIPLERRGAAMGKVMGAFSLASVLGVPFGLELSRLFAWQIPFITLGLAAFATYIMAWFFLPPDTNELSKDLLKFRMKRLRVTLQNPLAWSAWGFTACAMIAAFMIIPNFTSHVQFNMNFPRDKLGIMYLFSGTVSFFSMRLVGKIVDKTGATLMSILSTVLFVISILFGFVFYKHGLTPIFFSMFFTVAMTSRNIAGQTLSSEVPLPVERASFMSLQMSITHASCAIGAFISSMILTENADTKQILHTGTVGWISIVLSLLIPVLFWNTERLLKRRAEKGIVIQVSEANLLPIAPAD